MSDSAHDVAADLLAETLAFTEEGEPEEVNEAPEGEQQQEEVENDFPEINWETPEELQDLLSQPDFDEEEEVEEFEGEGNVNYDTDEYDDPNAARLAKQLAKLQKQLAWEKEQKAKQGRKLWAEEARRYFQFSNPEVIQAKSRRAFLREAAAQHNAVAKVAKPVFDDLQKQKERIREEALAEAKVEAERRWGRPVSGPTGVQNIETTQSMGRERLEKGKNLKDVLKAKLQSGEVKI